MATPGSESTKGTKMAVEEGPADALRQAVAHAEDLIGSTLELVARAGAARWCAYLVPHENESWRVALATGAGAPDIGSVWSPAQVEHFVSSPPGDPSVESESLPDMILRRIHLPRVVGDAEPEGEEGSLSRRDSTTPAGLLCAAPNAAPADDDQPGLTETLHTLLDHLTALVTHHADQAERSERAGAVSQLLSGARAASAASAIADPVTGLLPKDLVLARLSTEVARAKRYGGGLSVLMCDLDELPAVATVAGSSGRDAILAAVGGALRAHLRQIDCAGRYDEDTLLLVLPETGAEESLQAGTRLAQFIAEAVAAVDLSPYLPEPTSAELSAVVPAVPAVLLRIGSSSYPVPAKSTEELVAQAQDALQAVRESGGEAWLGHALDRMNQPPAGGFRCVCRRCGNVFQVMDRAQQRARRFCSHECYTAARREGGQERDDVIRELRQQGESLRTIARRFGISAERVRQILDGTGSPSTSLPV